MSENYEQVFREQIWCPFREAQLGNMKKDYSQWISNVRKMMPQLPQKSSLPPYPVQKWPHLRDDQEDEIGYECAFCGNPWKIFKKNYRDGVEQKQESVEYDLSQEDQLLTKIGEEIQNKEYPKRRNKRKGFMRMNTPNTNDEIITEPAYEIDEPRTDDSEPVIQEKKTTLS